MANNALTQSEKIEERLDRVAAGAMQVSDQIGGILFSNMTEVMEFAKLMSLARGAVPVFLRENPGACLAITIQALEWRFSPFAVANKSYFVNDRIAYEAQLIHAVIEARAPLRERLRYRFEGEGASLRCTCIGHFKLEAEPRDVRSPPISQIKVKNSPLWASDPEQQLTYYVARAWARRHAPDILMGVYSRDELDEESGRGMEDVTPPKDADPSTDLKARLLAQKKDGARGFDHAHVDRQTAVSDAAVVTDATVSIPTNTPEPSEPVAATPEPVSESCQPAPSDGKPVIVPDAAKTVTIEQSVEQVDGMAVEDGERQNDEGHHSEGAGQADEAAVSNPADNPAPMAEEAKPRTRRARKAAETPAAPPAPEAPQPVPEPAPVAAGDDMGEFVRTKIADADQAAAVAEIDDIDDAVCTATDREKREDLRRLWNECYARNIQRLKRRK